jgi:hypothetical protein
MALPGMGVPLVVIVSVIRHSIRQNSRDGSPLTI